MWASSRFKHLLPKRNLQIGLGLSRKRDFARIGLRYEVLPRRATFPRRWELVIRVDLIQECFYELYRSLTLSKA